MLEKTVLVTGVFDVLHQEHFRFLKKAKALGGHLIVALENDQRVRQLKGAGRPRFPAAERLQNLAAWDLADEILILPDNFGDEAVRFNWLKKIKPDFLAVSAHSPFISAKEKMMQAIGGELRVVHQFNPQFSSSRLIVENKL